MESEQARLESYNKTKRTKQLARSTSGNNLKWPHPPSYLATPRTLAEAGFYFDPGPDDPDNVACFMCGKQLNEWEPDDDPFELHFSKCNRQCAWASARCGPEVEKGKDGQYHFADASRVPSSKIMEKARLETFTTKKGWPHDAVRNHGANSRQMAKAGFVYTPGGAGDDSATCFYCGVALNGWEEDDDPTQEHVKRANRLGTRCAFLNSSTNTRTVSKASTRSNDTKSASLVVAPSSEDELASSMASAYNLNTNVSRSMRSSVNRASAITATNKTPASGSRRSTRGTGSRATALTGSEVEDTEGGSGSEAGKRVSKTKGKRKAAASKAKDLMKVVEEEEEEPEVGRRVPDDEEVAIVQLPKPKRGPGRAPKPKKTESVMEGSELEPEPAPVPAKKAHARTRSKANLASDSDAPQPKASGSKSGSRHKATAKAKEAPLADTENEQLQDLPVAKPGRKRTKKGEDSEPPSDAPGPAQTKGAKGRTVSRNKAKQVVLSESDSDIEMLPEKEPPRKATAKVVEPRPQASSSKANRSAKIQEYESPTSDDAGYATAEPPAKSRYSRGRPSHASGRVSSGKATRAPERGDEDESDVEMLDDAPPAPKNKVKAKSPPRSTSSDVGSRPGAKKLSHVSSKPKVPRSSSNATKIVEISDDEDDDVPPPRNVRKGAIARAPSAKEGAKLQMEVVVPKRPSQASVASDTSSSKARSKQHADALLTRSFEPSARPASSGSGKGKKTQVEVLMPTKTSGGGRQSRKGAGLTSSPEMKADAADGGLVAVINGKHGAASTPPPANHVVLLTPSPAASPPPSTSPDDRPVVEQDDAFPFTPLLSTLPMQQLAALTDEEYSMTVEQWIRREIETQTRLLKEDAEKQLAVVREKAAEMRKVIEAL
ncbi:BIR-domain-containing protein [Daedalea quercina L-15889]|uniref:BIR-domain-containing protein n=1 Tax=Daedalea quercina L-15889 TaxID=1314783 RepID=A0A165Q3A1_9APHY|nr:BIR-domain-containing protein [Daedalea quercina L-15889]